MLLAAEIGRVYFMVVHVVIKPESVARLVHQLLSSRTVRDLQDFESGSADAWVLGGYEGLREVCK